MDMTYILFVIIFLLQKVNMVACEVAAGPKRCSPGVARHRGARLSLVIGYWSLVITHDFDVKENRLSGSG